MILVIGSQGFIGSHIVQHFLSQGFEVLGCDLVEFSTEKYYYQKISILSSDFAKLFLENTFDICINASGSGNVGFSVENPMSDFEANSLSVIKALDTIRKYQPTCKYVHISSAAVYGNPKQLPVNESDTMAPLSPYGYHKMISELICKEYHHLYQLQISIIRPFSVYGIGLKKQLLWDICQKLQCSNDITLFGTGNESRDFIHISDLVRLIELIIQKSTFNCCVFNAASGVETTIKSLALIFEKQFNGIKRIGFSGQVKQGDPLNWVSSITKLKDIGFSTTIDFETGVINYLNWYKAINHEQ
jgi:UDP-glucose 4-epimerase